MIAAPATLFLVLTALTIYLGVNDQTVFRQNRIAVVRAHELVVASQAVLAELQDAEAARRGWLLTHEPAFLRRYQAGTARIGPAMDRLERWARSDPAAAARAAALRRALQPDLQALQPGLVAPGDFSPQDQAFHRAEAAIRGFASQAEQALVAQRGGYDRQRNYTFLLVMIAAAAAMLGLAYSLSAIIGGGRQLQRRAAERDAARAARQRSDLLYRTMFDNAADFLFVIDIAPDGRLVLADVNPALERAIGRPAEELRGRYYDEVTPPDLARLFHQHLAQIARTGAPATYDDPVQTVQGLRIWETTLAPVFDEGRMVRIVGFARDATARAEAEEQIRRAQRMEAVGQLTGGVAHDFNNLLQVIRANLELLIPRVAGDETAGQRLRSALRGADQAAQLTRQLLAFARRQPLEPKVVNLGRLVGEMLDLLRRSLGERVALDVSIPAGLWNTRVDPAQVESAILNLALNARDAMPGGGRLALELSNAVLGEAEARRFEDVAPGDYVCLSMRDTGEGMAPEVLARVFEPFFTTKGEEKGTGLGLSMVYGFVKQSHGHIQLSSVPGEGTTVRVYLPRSLQAEARAAEPVAQPGAPSVALVVDDEEPVRVAARQMLEELGYACLEAADGESALGLISSGAPVRLLLTDIVMPGAFDGVELAQRARALRPDLAVLLTSGFAGRLERGGPHEEFTLLCKPYGRSELARKLQAALQAERPVVLVVEDDPLVRLSALDMVEDLGFSAASAGAAEEALSILQAEGRVDILFTDIGLPDMRGDELARTAVALRPDLKVVFASGYADGGEGPDGAVWLAKPYEQKELSTALSGLAATLIAQRSA